jgi:glutamate synthase domain-containing protein 1
MCGIAGIIHKQAGKGVNIGEQMTSMLQALKHRGPDSTGYAMYGEDNGNQIMRFKVAEAADLEGSYDIHAEIESRLSLIDSRLAELGVKIVKKESPTEYAHRYEIEFSGDMKKVADFIEDIEGVEILSIGNSLELVKDLGDAAIVSEQYGLNNFNGTHGIGHTRMATESDVDIRSAHPYWAYPFSDVAVVHNGQLTNYWTNRRALERKGHRFSSNCDSELIAVYIADRA